MLWASFQLVLPDCERKISLEALLLHSILNWGQIFEQAETWSKPEVSKLTAPNLCVPKYHIGYVETHKAKRLIEECFLGLRLKLYPAS